MTAATTAELVTGGDDGDETRNCPECGEPITGPAKGAGSVAWKLGLHRRNKHGVKGTGRAGRKKAGTPTEADHAAHPVIAGIQDVAAQIGGGGKVPNADDLANGLGRGLELASLGAATILVESDPTIPKGPAGDAIRDQLIDYLSLSTSASRSIMRPVGRALAPTKINRRYGRTIVDNVDLVGSVAEIVQLGYHLHSYMQLRSEGIAQIKAAQAGQQGPPALYAVPDLPQQVAPAPVMATQAPVVPPAGEVAYPNGVVTEPNGYTHTAPGVHGVVIDATTVQAMRARAGLQ